MFSSHRTLYRKTPAHGINRPEYIGLLVDEYYSTSRVEAEEQVTANLANFAYDPINWPYLIASGTLELFLELLSKPNYRLQLHGIAGLCNFCLDETVANCIKEPKNTAIIKEFFANGENPDIVLNCITLFQQILSEDTGVSYKECLVTPALLKRIQHWQEKSNDVRVTRICVMFLEDFGVNQQNAFIEAPTL